MSLGRSRRVCGAGALLLWLVACGSEGKKPNSGTGGTSGAGSMVGGGDSGASSMAGGSDSGTSGSGGSAGDATMTEAGAGGADEPACDSCPSVAGCVDLASDPKNCGKCGRVCGAGAECVEGKCGCPEGTLNCSDETLLECRPVLSDPKNCGECERECLPGSKCYDGSCAIEVEAVQLYGDADAGPGGALLAHADDGGFFVGLSTAGPHRALPSGEQPLWEGAAVGKLAADFDVEWLVPTTAKILAVASAGSDFWVVVRTNGDEVSFGTSSYGPAFGRSGLVLAFKLKGDDGTILEEHRFDTVDTNVTAKLVADADGAWLTLGTLVDAIDYQGLSSSPPSSGYSSVLYRLGSATPRWLPGTVNSLNFDDQERLLLGAWVNGGGGSISFGGPTFVGNYKSDATAAARYAKPLKHETSFFLPPEFGWAAQAVLPFGDEVLFVGHDDAFLKIYDASGTIKTAEGPDGARFTIVASQVHAGKLHFIGQSWGPEHTFAGVELASGDSFFMTFDVATAELQAALHASVESPFTSFVIDDTGTKLVLARSMGGALWLDGKTYGTNGTHGVAFVELKLNTP